MSEGIDAPPLLRAEQCRVEVDGVSSLETFDLTTTGRRLVAFGGAAPLVSAITGVPLGHKAAALAALHGDLVTMRGASRVAAGRLLVDGRDVARGDHQEVVGVASFDPSFPEDVSVVDWLTDAAVVSALRRGTDGSRAEARRRATSTLELLNLGPFAKVRIPALSPLGRRAYSIALGAVGEPDVLILETPLSGLASNEAAPLLAAIDLLGKAGPGPGRGMIISVSRVDQGGAERALVRSATDLVGFANGALSFFGTPAKLAEVASRSYRMTVRANAPVLVAALVERGATTTGGPERFSIVLPEGLGATDVLRLAHEHAASVVEILPVM